MSNHAKKPARLALQRRVRLLLLSASFSLPVGIVVPPPVLPATPTAVPGLGLPWQVDGMPTLPAFGGAGCSREVPSEAAPTAAPTFVPGGGTIHLDLSPAPADPPAADGRHALALCLLSVDRPNEDEIEASGSPSAQQPTQRRAPRCDPRIPVTDPAASPLCAAVAMRAWSKLNCFLSVLADATTRSRGRAMDQRRNVVTELLQPSGGQDPEPTRWDPVPRFGSARMRDSLRVGPSDAQVGLRAWLKRDQARRTHDSR